MMPASGNENDLNMPSGTIEIFVRCYVEVERMALLQIVGGDKLIIPFC